MSEIRFSFHVERDAGSGSPLPVRKWPRDASDADSGAVKCVNRAGRGSLGSRTRLTAYLRIGHPIQHAIGPAHHGEGSEETA